jgi:cbb3-type cytochrome oxidase maturation protein
MSILFVLIALGLLLMGIAVWAFFWAVDKGQFDDLDGPASSILDDHETSDPRQLPAPAHHSPRA